MKYNASLAFNNLTEITGLAPLLALFEKWLLPRIPGQSLSSPWDGVRRANLFAPLFCGVRIHLLIGEAPSKDSFDRDAGS
jgi:hypothetical protein